jgi:FkbM family methyltransferase
MNNFESREFAYIVMEIIGRPTHVAEVGTFDPSHLQVLPFVFDKECKVQLFEPNPQCVINLRAFFKKQDHVEINEIAIGSEYGQGHLQVPRKLKKCPDAASSAFLEGIYSPYSAREEAGRPEDMDSVRVEVAPLSEFDDGTIEALAIDTEGHEWAVIQGMTSRPRVVSVEMRGKFGYENPFTAEIEEWFRFNGYHEHSREKTDNIYVRPDND